MRIFKTKHYDHWFRKLKDVNAKASINVRLRRIELAGELVGDCKTVGQGITELRFDLGPGYRVYVHCLGDGMLLLLGGDKSTQVRDIEKARSLLNEWSLIYGR